MMTDTICPKCGKGYGTNTRKDGSIRCRLCGFEGRISRTIKTTLSAKHIYEASELLESTKKPAMTSPKPVESEHETVKP